MSVTPQPAPRRVPTLTEVVLVAPTPVPAQTQQAAAPPMPMDEAAIAQRVLQDVQRQLDLMLEYRLRDALAPLLARLSDTLVREARDELASTLRDAVARAVAQELERQRGR